MLVLGEIHTGLLQNSTSLALPRCESVLGFVQGEAVRRSERPISLATSSDLLAGIDCGLPAASGARVRGIGTVLHRAIITGGRVVQGSALARVAADPAGRRRPWSHYLARPGQLEAIGKVDWADLASGFAAGQRTGSTLDLGAISGRVLDLVQTSLELDRCPPIRAARTKLRWVATTDGHRDQSVTFGIEHGQLRTLRLSCGEAQVAAVPELCEDLARHDWLLTTVVQLIERSRIGTEAPGQVAVRLRPVIDHLLHLWMPAARVDQGLVGLWESLERRPGFSRQWQALVNRIRDQLAIATIALLSAGARP